MSDGHCRQGQRHRILQFGPPLLMEPTSYTGTNGAHAISIWAKMIETLSDHRGTGPGQIEFENLFNDGGMVKGQHQLFPRVDYNGNPSNAYLNAIDDFLK